MPYARAAIVRLKRSSDLDEVVRRVREHVATLQRAPGFISYTAIQTRDDEVIALTLWDTREQAEAAAQRTERWKQEQVAAMLEASEASLGAVLIHEVALAAAQ
jgi:heme-degrading monooxygenase HmoA